MCDSEFSFDSRAPSASLFSTMDQTSAYQKLLTPVHIGVGLVSSLGVFVFLSVILLPYTFSPDPLIAQLQACLAAVPIATTFWLSVNMFMIVLADQRKRREKR